LRDREILSRALSWASSERRRVGELLGEHLEARALRITGQPKAFAGWARANKKRNHRRTSSLVGRRSRGKRKRAALPAGFGPHRKPAVGA
jgi:hypothetical protein